MKRLTENQKQLLESLKENETLYTGYNCPDVMRTFNALVRKGLATVRDIIPGYGVWFQISE